jgi:transcriptional regulator with XRE-family HTH domain
VSLGYLSEVERGQKEASSELLAAICSALKTPLSQVFREVSDNFALAELQNEPVLAGAREPALQRPAAVGMDAPGTPQVFTGAGAGADVLTVKLPPGQATAFDDEVTRQISDEVTRQISDLTDMVPA